MASEHFTPLLPLPYVEVEQLRTIGLSRGARQRISRRRFAQFSVNEVVLAVNSLAGIDSPSSAKPSGAQPRSWEHLRNTLHDF